MLTRIAVIVERDYVDWRVDYNRHYTKSKWREKNKCNLTSVTSRTQFFEYTDRIIGIALCVCMCVCDISFILTCEKSRSDALRTTRMAEMTSVWHHSISQAQDRNVIFLEKRRNEPQWDGDHDGEERKIASSFISANCRHVEPVWSKRLLLYVFSFMYKNAMI